MAGRGAVSRLQKAERAWIAKNPERDRDEFFNSPEYVAIVGNDDDAWQESDTNQGRLGLVFGE